MSPTEYLHSKLDDLKNLTPRSIPEDELPAEIFRLLMSKKFRKYSVASSYQKHILDAIKINITQNAPIKLTFPFGGYKLWRLPEAPEADWAELFSLLYFANWLKPICEIYKPGVNFIFYADDVIVPRMNNIREKDIRIYRESFLNLLKFVRKYIPQNLFFTYKRVIDQYKNQDEFEVDLSLRVELLSNSPEQMPPLNDKRLASIKLNVRPTQKEKNDPNWQAKIHLLHQAYLGIKYKRSFYHKDDNILIFTTPITDALAVGMTKHSIAKFWCGIGVLEKDGNDFHQLILTPKQIANSTIKKKLIDFDLIGKNFSSINIKHKFL